MFNWFSFAAVRNWFLRCSFSRAGLRSATTDLGGGTVVHCWVPRRRRDEKPNLVLLHGIGANAMWQWNDFIVPLIGHYNLYVPDLLFFGGSYTSRPERSEAFQAQSVARFLEAHGVEKMNVLGMSYGGFVAYSMAAQFPERVERLVLCCAGVSMEEKDSKEAVAQLRSVDEAFSVLFPQTPDKMRELLDLCFHKPVTSQAPSWVLKDFIKVMCTEHLQERKGLIEALLKDRKLSDLPRITQKNILLIWGEYDKLFPLEFAHRIKKQRSEPRIGIGTRFLFFLFGHVGEHVELAIIKNVGHAITAEAPKEMLNHMKSFLIDPLYASSNDLKMD